MALRILPLMVVLHGSIWYVSMTTKPARSYWGTGPAKDGHTNRKNAPLDRQGVASIDQQTWRYRCYNRTGRAVLLEEFIDLCDEVERRTKTALNCYLQNNVTGALHNNKNIWKKLKHIGLLPTSDDALHGFTPDELNAHFSGVFVLPEENVKIAADIINAAGENGFAFKPVSLADVHAAVKHFTSQAIDEDGIPQSVVAKALPVVGDRLVELFNASFARGVFPASWKRAQLLAKASVPSSPSDFKQIALFCFLSKVLEKWSHYQVVDFLEEGSLLDTLQKVFENCTTLRLHFSN